MKTEDCALALNIAAVERETGLSKDTLRVWERRYGFPMPERDVHGERQYPIAQVEKLRLIRRLLDQGRRPAGIIGASTAELAALAEGEATARGRVPADSTLLQYVRLHRSAELAAALRQSLLKQGLQRFVADTVAPLTEAVGEAWLRGEIEVADEHLFTEQIQNVLRSACSAHAGAPLSGGSRPRVLLATFHDEAHSLGLLMAEAILVSEGASVVSLGTRMPLADLQAAVLGGAFDVLGLSFSAAYPQRHAIEGLLEMRALLPSQIALWAGGSAVQGKAKRLPGIRVVGGLDDTLAALVEWRASHAD